jgi:hypothetical protein
MKTAVFLILLIVLSSSVIAFVFDPDPLADFPFMSRPSDFEELMGDEVVESVAPRCLVRIG